MRWRSSSKYRWANFLARFTNSIFSMRARRVSIWLSIWWSWDLKSGIVSGVPRPMMASHASNRSLLKAWRAWMMTPDEKMAPLPNSVMISFESRMLSKGACL